MSQLFASGGQWIGLSASASVLPMNIPDWFPLGWTGSISLQSKGLPRVFSNTVDQKHWFFGLSFLCGSTLTSIHDYWKNHTFDQMDFCQKSNVCAFQCAVYVGHSFSSKEQVAFNFMAASPSAVILEPKKIKSLTVSTVSPSICHLSDGARCHDLSFLNVEF